MQTGPRPLLSVEDLHIAFRLEEGTVQAVRGAGFQIMPGQTVALVGESGSGKSVISQAITGILPKAARITRGHILFDDPDSQAPPVDIAALARDSRQMRQIRGGRISIIFQEPMTSLSPLHTVGNQIAEAVRLHRNAGEKEAYALAEEMLGLVGFPDPNKALSTYPFELSGGLRQRAMIAMALVCRPALLIADEPTTALDVTIQAQILKLIVDLQKQLGMAVLMITHDLGVVANVADKVVVLYHGEIMEAGTVDALYRDPRHPYLRALLRAVPRFHMEPGERLVPIREIKSRTTGQLMAARTDDMVGPAPGEPLLSIDGVTKTFGLRKGGMFGRGGTKERILAVDDISFTIRRGECLGLVGESGCGKTTLSKMIMRALTPDRGTIRLHEPAGPIDVHGLEGGALDAYRRRVQFVFQDPFSSLNPRMTVFDLVSEPLDIHGIGSRTSRADMVRELLEVVGLDSRHMQRYPHSFSGGQRQRIGIARALALRPELLLLDEPVSALDVSIQAQILNLLKDLKAQLGLTYLFVSHNLAVVDYIADRIAVMCAGRLVELAPRETLFRDPQHPYTKALLAAVPEPDLDHPLDFAQLMTERASKPALWPAPFTVSNDSRPRLTEITDGHFVRMTSSTTQPLEAAQ